MRKVGERMSTVTLPAQTEATSDRGSSARGVPPYNWRAHWLTVTEFSRMMGRRPQTVYWWVGNGTLAEFGIPVCQFRHGGLHSGRTFIQNIY
jgi:hypothetical protein